MDALTKAQEGLAPDEGTTSDFHTRISVAHQSLARAAAADVTGLSGRQTIQTVTGLIATYSGWIEDAQAESAGSQPSAAGKEPSPLPAAFQDYAGSVLQGDADSPTDASVIERLKALQSEQQKVVREQTDFGPLLWLEWGVALALVLGLLVLLAEAHRFSGARFRRQWNPALLGAAVLLVAGTAVLVVFTVLTHSGLADARAALATSPTGDGIPRAGAEVSRRLAGTGFRAAAAYWILAGGPLLAAFVVLGLQPRINEYRLKVVVLRRPRPRSLGVLALCLVVLAGGGAVVVQATGWNGSVTLLANWTGGEQEEFQRLVIDKFEHKYRIHVVYQGSSAESQVLAADVEFGTPPDVAVLPGPGELAGFAAKGMLTPLDDLVREADFGSTWVTPAIGADGTTHAYWLPIKTDLKSMVWHPQGQDDTEVEKAARQPGAWCLGMGSDATSGWPGSDWIEDILLQQTDQDTYTQWVNGEVHWKDDRVRTAWQTWGKLVGAGDPRYTVRALKTNFGDAAEGAGSKPPTCGLEHQSSFARGSVGWREAGGAAYVHSAKVIPGASADSNRWEVSGDLAAVLHSTPQSRKLIGYLASDEAQRARIGTQTGFSVEHTVLADYPDTGVIGEMADTLRSPGAVRCYDASDAMPPQVRDAFALAVLRYLADPTTLDRQLAELDRVTDTLGKRAPTSVCSQG